ncbi:MAG: hypothetical protein RL518_809 [Pseudomonadota bacterium]|jgi:hypothetical protein
MNWSTLPLLVSASITLVSIGVGAVAYNALEHEETARVISLGPVATKPIRYAIVASQEPDRCVGSFTTSIESGSGQTTINLEGWLLVEIARHIAPVRLEASMVFNALGQLSVSLVRTNYRNESLRLGSTGVNPMNLQVYRGDGAHSPLLRQSVPGPIELRVRDGEYELHVPLLTAFRGPHPLSSHTSLVSLSVGPSSTEASCSIESARPFDLEPLIHVATSLAHNMKGMVPGS